MSPTSLEDLRNEAYRRYQAGDCQGAEWFCRQVLQYQPNHTEAIYLLGVIANDVGKLEQAREFFRHTAQLSPGNAVFTNALGEVNLNLGRQEEALACFRQAIASRPSYERAHNNLGRALHALGDLPAAEASFTEAVRLNPRYPTAHNNLGAALQAQGQVAKAGDHFRQALALRPDYPEAHFNLGTVLQAQDDPVSAAGCFQEAIRLRPNYVRAHFHLGQVLEQLRQDYAALASYETADRLQPDDPEILRRLGDLLVLKKDWPAALAALEKAAALRQDDPEPFARLASARQQVCDWRAYTAELERLWADAEKQIAAGKATAVVPFQAVTLPWPRQRLLAVARSHCESLTRRQHDRGVTLNVDHPHTRPDRLRIGYVSGDFYDHPISHLLQGLFGCHDRSQFEVFAYSFGPPDQSSYRRRIIAGCDHFIEVAPLSSLNLAQRIVADGIHILVDLMGHTGVNRLGAFALRPAPIQVSFLGMLGTTGGDFLDYLITDRIVTPPEYAPDFVEKLVTLPDCYLIAEPLDPADRPDPAIVSPDLRKANGLPEDGFVFCSFNSAYKIEPGTFNVWMKVLSRVPGSVLWLHSTGALLEDNLRREAMARGVPPERLVFASFLPRPEHIARHRAADLFLDTLVYNAAATASLALQTGLPVLTCLGETFASRVGASLLNAVGLPEMIAPNALQYEELAVWLATRPDEIARIRAKLVVHLPTAPLFDASRFVRHLERAYQTMWQNWAEDPDRDAKLS
jgi:predicted O-linked N-acetylglucosamine transferase (SPINDLY family)